MNKIIGKIGVVTVFYNGDNMEVYKVQTKKGGIYIHCLADGSIGTSETYVGAGHSAFGEAVSE